MCHCCCVELFGTSSRAEIAAMVLPLPPALNDDDPMPMRLDDGCLVTADNARGSTKSIAGFEYNVDCLIKSWLLSRHLARVSADLNAVVVLATSIGLLLYKLNIYI